MTYRHYLLASLRASLSAVAMVAIATTMTACSNSQAEAPSPPPPPEVDAAQVVTTSVRQWDVFTGRIAAIGAVDIRPRVSGYIERIAFKEGDTVKAGALLFVIDQRPYRAAYDSAMAQLERARASVQLAEAQNKRAESLIKTGAISIDTLDTRSAALGQTNADVHAAEAALATAKLNLDFTEVRAPIAGKVSRAVLTLGNLVQADQTVLTSVVSQDPVYVYFQPDEQSFLRYCELGRKGERANSDNAVRVGLASETGFPHAGTVNFVNNPVDAASRHGATALSSEDRWTARSCGFPMSRASSSAPVQRSSCESISAVVHTLFEAIALVVLVVIVFLQTWRASIIPLIAVPVSVRRHLRGSLSARLFHQHALAVRPGARDRHRRR